ncbi:hypothetical protein ACWD04_30230 [Streptomyces sp. NPDC002911]
MFIPDAADSAVGTIRVSVHDDVAAIGGFFSLRVGGGYEGRRPVDFFHSRGTSRRMPRRQQGRGPFR